MLPSQHLLELAEKAPGDRESQRADNHASAPARGRCFGAFQRPGKVGQQLSGAARQRFAGERRRDALGVPLEQCHPELVLQITYLTR
jgi:hypothetical protein